MIRRAAELELAPPGRRGEAEGLTLADIEKIAAEAGLSPDSVRHAARELEGGSGASVAGRIFGGGAVHRSRTIAREVDDSALGELLAELPDLAGIPGSGSVSSRGLVFRSDGGYESNTGTRFRLEIRRSGGSLAASVQRSFAGAVSGVYSGIVGGLGIGAGVGVGVGIGVGELHSALFATLVPIAFLGLSFLLSRGVLGLISRNASRKNERLLDAIDRRLCGPKPL